MIDSLLSGGAQRQIVTLAISLKKKGYDLVVLNYHEGEQLLPLLEKNNIRRVLIKKKHKIDLLFFYRLIRFLRKENPDAAISYLNTANFWLMLAKLFAGVRLVITSERNIDVDRSVLRVFLQRILAPVSDLIVVNAYAIKDKLIEKVKINKSKIHVIYNGVNDKNFSKSSDEAITKRKLDFGIGEHEFVICLPGRIMQQKNHMCLVDALDGSLIENNNIKILFVGNEFDSSLVSALKHKIEFKGNSGKYIFAGQVDDMAIIYSLSDVVVLPSLWEGLPNVVIEAMACECPVVVSDVSDNRILVEDGVTGYVFEVNNTEKLREKIYYLVNKSIAEREMMGKKARAKVIGLCGIEAFVSAYERILCINVKPMNNSL